MLLKEIFLLVDFNNEVTQKFTFFAPPPCVMHFPYNIFKKCIALDFLDSLFGQVKNIALYLKIISKIERHLCLVTHTFTKLSQNVYLINTYILMYCYARCSCKLWKVPWFYCVFFWIFLNIIDDLYV